MTVEAEGLREVNQKTKISLITLRILAQDNFLALIP
jgi:hypothetical protein